MAGSELPAPARSDRFSFGLWTVGWRGVDVFGGPVREPMDPYLLIRQRVRAFRSDPEVRQALASARLPELAQPTLGPGESLNDVRLEDHDPEALARRGLEFEHLDQLALEHLLGAR